ncbi:hypothetical protein BJX70DRAFT_357997 [Aspergillus crustosus]
MAYYDDRPYDRYPPADYPETPNYYGSGAHGGSQAPTDVMPHSNAASGSRDAYYRNHPAKDAYEYGGYSRDSGRSHKSRRRGHSTDEYFDDPYDREPRSRRSRHYDERRGREKYAYSPSASRSPPRRRRSLSERALGALGLGAGAGAAAAAGSKHRDSDRGRSHGRHHKSHSYSPSPSRGGRRHREKSEQRVAQMVKAALTAGAVEAFRARKEPGDWSGPKGKRVLTAAIAAGGTDGLVDRNPDKHSKRHVLESTLAGLATNRLVNGSRSHSRHRRHSRSPSRSRGGSKHGGKTKDVALMGVLAAAGKKAYDRYQKSQSRSRPRRSDSRDSYDSYESRPRPSRKRSKSVSEYISKGMAALGIEEKGEKSDKHDRRRHRSHRSSRYDDYSDDDRYSDDDYHRRHPSPPRARHSRDVSRAYYIPAPGGRGAEGYGQTDVGYYSRPDPRPQTQNHEHQQNPKQNESDADDSTDDHKKLKKLNRETVWATSLAAAATIHAAHTLTESMKKHKQNSKAIKDGEITKEEARRRRMRNQFTDAASVGVAALGIKSAVGEWKNFDSKRRERAQLHRTCKERSKSMSKGGSGSSNSKNRSQSSSSRPQRTQSMSQRAPRTVYPDEIEENYSTSDYRPRSMARSPGVMV